MRRTPRKETEFLLRRTLATLGVLVTLCSCAMSPTSRRAEVSAYSGDYFGQAPPTAAPKLLLPAEFRETEDRHSAAVFSPDMNLVVWTESTAGKGRLYYMERRGERWTEPEPFRVIGPFADTDNPAFSPDGRYFYFTSHRPHIRALNGREKVWQAQIHDGRWSRARPLGPAVNTLDLHWQFSVSDDYTILIGARSPNGDMDIYHVPFENGSYGAATTLGGEVNTRDGEATPHVSNSAGALFFSRYGSGDPSTLFRARLDERGVPSPAVSLSQVLSPVPQQMCPVVTPDGRALVFLGPRPDGVSDIWWISLESVLAGASAVDPLP